MKKRSIRALSLDFDGCLFHERYIKSGSMDVVEQNIDFLQKIFEQNYNFSDVYALVGSNRQDAIVDFTNSLGNKGSCFPALEKIAKHLVIEIDRLLLADIYGDLEAGESFKRALNKTSMDQDHKTWVFDETKVTILYAQMHKLALEHSENHIVFDFYDDRGLGARAEHDILEQLRDFFSKHPDLIPVNVTLRLHHYAGDSVTLIKEIIGTGTIDNSYRQTIKEIAELCPRDEVGRIFPAIDLNPSQLNHRNFNASFGLFEKKVDELVQKANVSDSYKEAMNIAQSLQTNLKVLQRRYQENELTLDEFKSGCKNEISAARPVLERHRGWKQVLGNLLAAIMGLGVLYLGAIAVNKVFYGRYLFFKTDSEHKLDAMESRLDQIKAVSALG